MTSEVATVDEKRFTLRMDGKLFDQVKDLAEEHKRSVAKEIEYLVEEHIKVLKIGERSEVKQ
jgi:hypothetical protein